MKITKILCLISLFLFTSACEQEVLPENLKVNGMWALVEDGYRVNSYIELKDGQIMEYKAKDDSLFYSNNCLWVGDVNIEKSKSGLYTIENNYFKSKVLNGEISVVDNILYIGSDEFRRVETVEKRKIISYPQGLKYDVSKAGGELIIPYELLENVEGIVPSVEIVSGEEYVLGIGFKDTCISVMMSAVENLAEVCLIASFPGVKKEKILIHSVAEGEIKVNTNEYTFDYKAQSCSIEYVLEGISKEETILANTPSTWINNIIVLDGCITYELDENNTGTFRECEIKLYHPKALPVTIRIIQNYSSSEIIITPSYIETDYTSKQDLIFTYKIVNPREEVEVKVTSENEWITDIVNTDGLVRFSVLENNVGKARDGFISVQYGNYVNSSFKVVQAYSATEILLTLDQMSTDYKAKETLSFTYKIANPREGIAISTSTEDDWITNLKDANNTISFDILENNSGVSRIGSINLKYGDYASVNYSITQTYSASEIVLVSSSITTDYTSKNELSFTYSINNSREGEMVSASTTESWITDVKEHNGTISFGVLENNSGASRIGIINLKYGTYASVNYSITQTYSASEILLPSSSITTDYAYKDEIVFNYSINNPREGVTISASTTDSWIKNVKEDNGTITFSVCENNTGASRTGNISLKYGDYASVNYNITQTYSAPEILLPSSSITTDYASKNGLTFSYSINNPREGEIVSASTNESWITNVIEDKDIISFGVLENNTGASRTGTITLKYGDYASFIYNVIQRPQPDDLSLYGTANSYIIIEPGAYKFKTVKGNSLESVGVVASVEVLWESFGTDIVPDVGDLIKTVYYADEYVTFEVNEVFKEGNALIAVKDVSGTILWSWHIWLTDKPQDQVYYNDAGIMLDRNLGATSVTPGDVCALGLMYQWGRKDPFLGSSSTGSGTMRAKSTGIMPSAVKSNPSYGTIEYAQRNPTTFIICNDKNYDWYYSGDSSTDYNRWTPVKTIYDPCPVGYRVPTGGYGSIWSKLESSNVSLLFGNNGITFSHNSSDVQSIWYPYAGHLEYNSGQLIMDGGDYWSVTSLSTESYYAYKLTFYLGYGGFTSYHIKYGDYRSSGLSVRCCKE